MSQEQDELGVFVGWIETSYDELPAPIYKKNLSAIFAGMLIGLGRSELIYEAFKAIHDEIEKDKGNSD